jgi:hypothetical protein
MKRFNFWQRWLLVLSIVIMAFGVFMAIFNQSAIFELFNQQIDPVFWGQESHPGAYAQFQGWVHGVLGATMSGWGLMLFFVIQHPFQQQEKWAWKAIAASLGFWYLLDTALSLYFGVNFNAVFNTLLLILVMLPLFATRADFSNYE